jgi:hypothetical protein
LGEQYAVDLSDQAVGEREAPPQALQAVAKGRDVVRDLHDIVQRAPGASSISCRRRSDRDDWVPSILDDSTASLRT